MFPSADSSYRLQPVLPFCGSPAPRSCPGGSVWCHLPTGHFSMHFPQPSTPAVSLPPCALPLDLPRALSRRRTLRFYCPYALSILCSHMDTVVKTCRINCQFHTHFPPVSNQNTSPCVTAAPPSVSARSAPVSVRRSLKRCCIFSCSAASVSFACADTSSDTAEIVCTESAISSICRLKL